MSTRATIIETRTQEALQTLTEHKDYCSNLERDYLFKHDELKMYIDFINNINREVNTIILEEYQDDNRLTESFINLIDELGGSLREQVGSTEELEQLKMRQNRMINNITQQFNGYLNTIRAAGEEQQIQDYADRLNHNVSPKLLTNPIESFNDYNSNTFNTLPRRKKI